MRDVHQVQRQEPGEDVHEQVRHLDQQQPAQRPPVPQRGGDLPRPRRPRPAPLRLGRPRLRRAGVLAAAIRRAPQVRAEPDERGEPGQHQVAGPPAAAAGQHRGEQQRPGHRPRRSGQVPARHDLGLPVRPGVHDLGLSQRHERAGCRVEGDEGAQQHGERASRGHAEEREHEDDAAAENGQPTSPALAGQDAERQLEEAADQQRHRGQQPDLRVAQPQVAPDQRERGSLGPVNQLVGELDRERDGENGKRRPSASSETHADHATATLAVVSR